MESHKKLVEKAGTLTLQNTSDNSLSQLNEPMLTLQKFLDTYKSKDTYNLLGLKVSYSGT
jgi:hypothetical protein